MSNDLEKILQEFKSKNQWPGVEEVLPEEGEERKDLDLDFHVMPADYQKEQGEAEDDSLADGIQGLGKKRARAKKTLIMMLLLLLIGLWLFTIY